MASTPPPRGASVLFGQHDVDDALGDGRIRRVGRVIGEGLVEVVNFEKYRVAVGLKRAEVVFAIRIVGVAEIVIDRSKRRSNNPSEKRPDIPVAPPE